MCVVVFAFKGWFYSTVTMHKGRKVQSLSRLMQTYYAVCHFSEQITLCWDVAGKRGSFQRSGVVTAVFMNWYKVL